MIEDFRRLLFDIHPLMVPGAGLLALLLVAWISDVFAKRRLVRLARRIAGSTRTALDDTIIAHGVIERVAQLLPAIVIYLGIGLVPELPEAAEKFVRNVALAVLALLVVMAISAVLSAANAIYELRPDSDRRPIKGYVQLAKIIVYCMMGGRAGKAKDTLEGLGFTNVENAGGYEDIKKRFAASE